MCIISQSCLFLSSNDSTPYYLEVFLFDNVDDDDDGAISFSISFELKKDVPVPLEQGVGKVGTLEKGVYSHFSFAVPDSVDDVSQNLLIEVAFSDREVPAELYVSSPSTSSRPAGSPGKNGADARCYCSSETVTGKGTLSVVINSCALESGLYRFSVRSSTLTGKGASFTVKASLRNAFVKEGEYELGVEKSMSLLQSELISLPITLPPFFLTGSPATDPRRILKIRAFNIQPPSVAFSGDRLQLYLATSPGSDGSSPSQCNCFNSEFTCDTGMLGDCEIILEGGCALTADVSDDYSHLFLSILATDAPHPTDPVTFTLLIDIGGNEEDTVKDFIDPVPACGEGSAVQWFRGESASKGKYQFYSLPAPASSSSPEKYQLSLHNLRGGTVKIFFGDNSLPTENCASLPHLTASCSEGGDDVCTVDLACGEEFTHFSVLALPTGTDPVLYDISVCIPAIVMLDQALMNVTAPSQSSVIVGLENGLNINHAPHAPPSILTFTLNVLGEADEGLELKLTQNPCAVCERDGLFSRSVHCPSRHANCTLEVTECELQSLDGYLVLPLASPSLLPLSLPPSPHLSFLPHSHSLTLSSLSLSGRSYEQSYHAQLIFPHQRCPGSSLSRFNRSLRRRHRLYLLSW